MTLYYAWCLTILMSRLLELRGAIQYFIQYPVGHWMQETVWRHIRRPPSHCMHPLLYSLRPIILDFGIVVVNDCVYMWTLIGRFMGPTWGSSGADRTQVDPMLAPWTLLSGNIVWELTQEHRETNWNTLSASFSRMTFGVVSLQSECIYWYFPLYQTGS